MNDIDGFLTHCYDLLLQSPPSEKNGDQETDSELCVCAKLVDRSEAKNNNT